MPMKKSYPAFMLVAPLVLSRGIFPDLGYAVTIIPAVAWSKRYQWRRIFGRSTDRGIRSRLR